MPESIHFKRPGEDVTCQVTVAVVGKRVVAISANRTSGPGLSNTAEGSVYRVAPCAGATMVPFGVAKYDQPTVAGKVGVATGGILPIEAGAAVAAGELVMADALGRVVPYVGPIATNAAAVPDLPIPVGQCMSAASGVGVDCEVKLMLG